MEKILKKFVLKCVCVLSGSMSFRKFKIDTMILCMDKKILSPLRYKLLDVISATLDLEDIDDCFINNPLAHYRMSGDVEFTLTSDIRKGYNISVIPYQERCNIVGVNVYDDFKSDKVDIIDFKSDYKSDKVCINNRDDVVKDKDNKANDGGNTIDKINISLYPLSSTLTLLSPYIIEQRTISYYNCIIKYIPLLHKVLVPIILSYLNLEYSQCLDNNKKMEQREYNVILNRIPFVSSVSDTLEWVYILDRCIN